jgi:hypothetical protein
MDRDFLLAFDLKAPASTSGSAVPISTRKVSRPRADVNIPKLSDPASGGRLIGQNSLELG